MTKSLYDIGVRVMSAADITRAMLADFDSVKGGSVFDATQVRSFDNLLRHQSTILRGTMFDQCVTQSIKPEPLLILNTMTKPCIAQCAQSGSKVKVLRCMDFRVEKSFRKSYVHLSLPKIELLVFTSTTR